MERNYIKIDLEDGVYMVYDIHGSIIEKIFSSANKAEKYAMLKSKQHNCDWGCNY